MIAAVIGHGPSPVGKRWGQQIDAADAVIRMWNCEWQSPEDYGTRYDVGVFTAWPKDLAIFRRSRSRDPQQWWVYDLGLSRGKPLPPEALEQPQRSMDARPWIAGLRRAGARCRAGSEPTRGTITILSAMEWLRPKRLVLVGFDGVQQASGVGSVQYPAAALVSMRAAFGAAVVDSAPAQFDDKDCSPTHDLRAEHRVVVQAAAAFGVTLEWGFA